jgi:hypothetical protein
VALSGEVFGFSTMAAGGSAGGGVAGIAASISDFFGSSAFVQPPAAISVVKSNKDTIKVKVLFMNTSSCRFSMLCVEIHNLRSRQYSIDTVNIFLYIFHAAFLSINKGNYAIYY